MFPPGSDWQLPLVKTFMLSYISMDILSYLPGDGLLGKTDRVDVNEKNICIWCKHMSMSYIVI